MVKCMSLLKRVPCSLTMTTGSGFFQLSKTISPCITTKKTEGWKSKNVTRIFRLQLLHCVLWVYSLTTLSLLEALALKLKYNDYSRLQNFILC